jgi:hypothetical protein
MRANDTIHNSLYHIDGNVCYLSYNDNMTKLDEVDAPQSRAYLGTVLPTMPYQYYEVATNDVDSCTWRGGEIAFCTTDNVMYIQTQTSGTTPVWKRYGDGTAAA